jgi:hypothetical protein
MSFGEVKSIESKGKTRSLSLGLYRLLHFLENTVDHHGYNQVLDQAIGPKLTSYIYTLLGDAMYLMMELFTFQILWLSVISVTCHWLISKTFVVLNI